MEENLEDEAAEMFKEMPEKVASVKEAQLTTAEKLGGQNALTKMMKMTSL